MNAIITLQIQRLVQLQKIRKDLAESAGGMDEDVSEEEWAEAAGETVESLRSALDSGASAKQALGALRVSSRTSCTKRTILHIRC